MNKRSHFSPIVFALVLVIGIWLGKSLQFGSTTNQEFNKFNLVLEQLEQAYVDSINKDELVEKAVTSLLKELDPHSYYIKAKDLSAVNEPMEGSFDGIGIEFNLYDDTILVVAPISGGPSQSVGILSGDKIVSVDGDTIAGTGLENEDVISLLRGKRGTKVTVGILRRGNNELIPFEITRGQIPINSVEVSYMVDDSTGYIKISRFAANTFDEFKSACDQLNSAGMQKLILDLRNNPGGYLGAAINVSNEFLADDLLIVYTQDRNGDGDYYYSNKKGALIDKEVVVIIDEGSASASEIVAGALQDNDRGTIVGRRSFGKGLVQEQFEHPDGSAYRITTQRYYTPTGRCIQRPYSVGDNSQYDDDIVNRINNGELLSQDSIVFNDSLKFVTKAGKVVYGGGGIMPDVFIPIDTTSYHPSLSMAIRKDLIRQFAFKYTNENRSQLEQQSVEGYVAFFDLPANVINDLSTFCQQNEVLMPIDEFTTYDVRIIKTQLKAYIARGIWNDEGFFPTIHKIDLTFQKAKQY